MTRIPLFLILTTLILAIFANFSVAQAGHVRFNGQVAATSVDGAPVIGIITSFSKAGAVYLFGSVEELKSGETSVQVRDDQGRDLPSKVVAGGNNGGQPIVMFKLADLAQQEVSVCLIRKSSSNSCARYRVLRVQ